MKNKYISFLSAAFLYFSSLSVAAQVTPKKVFGIDTTFTNIQIISIDGQFAKIDVIPSSDDIIHLKSELFSDSNDPSYQLVKTISDQKLTLKIQYPTKGWTSHSGYLQISIPKGKELIIITSSGLVSIKETVLNKVDVKTQTGNIEVTGTNGPLSVETVTAKISVSNTTGSLNTKSKTGEHFISKINGKVSAYSSDGNITIADVKESIRTESTTGKTNIDRIQGDIVSKSASGWVNIADSNGNLNVTTFSGPIKVFNNTGIVNLQSTTGDQVGTRLNLTGSSNFKTSEGKIKMELDNQIETLTFVLTSESAFIQAYGQSKKKKLNFGKGAIVVTGTSTSGGQIYN